MAQLNERLAAIATAIAPVLSRLVLTGPPVIDLLLNDPTVRAPRLSFAADSVFRFVTTSTPDRLRAELQKLGGTESGQSAGSAHWAMPNGTWLDLIQVRPDNGNPTEIWLEYATLLTLPFPIGAQLTIRMAGAAPTLALECSAYASNRGRAAESEELERALLLIAGRREIEKEVAGAPPELRAFVTSTLAGVVDSGAAEILLQRVLPDAALVPALALRARERVQRMAR